VITRWHASGDLEDSHNVLVSGKPVRSSRSTSKAKVRRRSRLETKTTVGSVGIDGHDVESDVQGHAVVAWLGGRDGRGGPSAYRLLLPSEPWAVNKH
jgi:hypothetical protein